MNRNSALPTNSPGSEAASPSPKYLPLGDSYTIGQSVAESERWPNQLVALLQKQNISLTIVANPSVTGYTSQNLIDVELPVFQRTKPDFVTIQIGVNDYVQGVSVEAFERNLDAIVQAVLSGLPNPQNIILVTIPDFGKTPAGAQFGDPAQLSAGIDEFNQVIVTVAGRYKVPVADIYAISQQVSTDESLTANDGLHPSGKQYTLWSRVVLDTINQNSLPKF